MTTIKIHGSSFSSKSFYRIFGSFTFKSNKVKIYLNFQSKFQFKGIFNTNTALIGVSEHF